MIIKPLEPRKEDSYFPVVVHRETVKYGCDLKLDIKNVGFNYDYINVYASKQLGGCYVANVSATIEFCIDEFSESHYKEMMEYYKKDLEKYNKELLERVG